MGEGIAVIIVTHNSSDYLAKCLKCLACQSHPVDHIMVVDSGSESREYLEVTREYEKCDLELLDNVGFARANNHGYANIPQEVDYVLFLNPDAFLVQDTIKKSLDCIRNRSGIGVISGRLLGYDVLLDEPTGTIDSTGVFRKIYGRWYDRGRNEPDTDQYLNGESVPALCGAFLFCRKQSLQDLGRDVFDPDFFMYKEDIELSLRLRKAGWQLFYTPEVVVYHCRGWSRRTEISQSLKKIASLSEILLYKKHPSPYIVWAYLKYWLVALFRV